MRAWLTDVVARKILQRTDQAAVVSISQPQQFRQPLIVNSYPQRGKVRGRLILLLGDDPQSLENFFRLGRYFHP